TTAKTLQREGWPVTVTRWDDAALAVVDLHDALGYRVGIAAPDFATVDQHRGLDQQWQTPPPAGGPLIPPGGDEHLGVVAADLAAVSAAHGRWLGRRTWHVLAFDSRRGSLTDTRFRGDAEP